MVADGEFTIDLTTGTGVATATGTIKYDISGVCKGSESLNYTFLVVGAVVKTTNNLTLAAQVPSPATSDAPVVCNGTQSTVAYSWTALGVPMVSLRAAHGGEAFGTAADGVLAYFVEIE